jgi:serine/threonine protein kinase/tetratricopeptide (TPR) repeat protein
MTIRQGDEAAIFSVARKIAALEARDEYLREACGDDQNLRDRVATLLRALTEDSGFLESPAACLGLTPSMAAVSEKPGTMIGPYKLVEQLGEGGMGLVFMAEQQQPLRRLVALKIIKPGMDTRQVIARFEAERQALALMHHPNIARIYDAGTTGDSPPLSKEGSYQAPSVSNGGAEGGAVRGDPASQAHSPIEKPASQAGMPDVHYGRPYFVMELVRGTPVTEYCDQARLPTRERLQLFITICEAVQHAHQKGIIHRDLKPSNVLVTMHDDKAVPKVIDFGVAKATNQRLVEQTLFTNFAQMIGTPTYMSPEQAQMSGLDVDTRSDVYSLGVLLYELLTGSTPFDKKRMREVGYDEMRRIIRDEEPPRPSLRVTSLDAASQSTIALNRAMDHRQYSQALRGDLDWIVMKALDKDRGRRYESMGAMIADVQRHLADEPVAACPPSAAYRLRKFARRNRTAAITTTIVALSLILGTAVSAWQAVRATLAQAQANAQEIQALAAVKAERAAKEAEAAQRQRASASEQQARVNMKKAREAVDQMLLRVAERLGNVPHMEEVRRELVGDALNAYESILEEHSTDPQVRFETGLAYRQYGRIQKTLGDNGAAEQAFAQAIHIFQELADESPVNPDYRLNLAHNRNELGRLFQDINRLPDAEQQLRQALAITRKLEADFSNPSDPYQYRRWVAGRLNDLGNILTDMGRLAEAESAHREALAMRKENPDFMGGLMETYTGLGNVLQVARRYPEAEEITREVLAHQEKTVAASPENGDARSQLVALQLNLARILSSTNRVAEAEKACRASIPICVKLVADFPAMPKYREQLAISFGLLAVYLEQSDEKEKTYRQSLALLENLAADFPNQPNYRHLLANCLNNLGNVFLVSDRLPETEAAYRRACELREKLATDFPSKAQYGETLAYTSAHLVKVLDDSGRYDEAEQRARSTLAIVEKLATDSPNVNNRGRALEWAHAHLGKVLFHRADWKGTILSLEKFYELGGSQNDGGPDRFMLAMAYWHVGDKEQAKNIFERAAHWMDQQNSQNNDELRRLRAEAQELLQSETPADP